MLQSQRLYFVALLPPQEIQDYANQIKQYFADKYASRHAQKSPPHITLQAPFKWADAEVPRLEEYLKDFASVRESVPITLRILVLFPPRVIYINVVRSLELMTLYSDLIMYLESNLKIVDKVGKTRPFAPHMTVAFRDLTKQNFKTAWSEFEKQQLHFEFTAFDLKLLQHDGRRWNVKSEFPLQKAYLQESP